VVTVATRNVVLTEHQDELIASLVKDGRYQNASEVLRAGLRLVEQQECEYEAKVEALREAAQKGWDDLDAGRYDDVADEDLDDFILNLGSRSQRKSAAG
jgi:antitoxin ParD1/3/4